MSTFQGLPTALFEFFVDLAQNNSKEFWEANRQRWQRDVKAPMSELVDELSSEFGPLRMFRPNRDLRFTQDKSPYKLWTGATSTPQATGGIGYYLSVSATGITTGYGAMRMTVQDWPTDTWMHTPQVHDRIRDTWAAVEPLRAWLNEHVSPRNH